MLDEFTFQGNFKVHFFLEQFEQVLFCALEIIDEPTIHIAFTPESLDYN